MWVFYKELLLGAFIGAAAHFGLRLDTSERLTVKAVAAYFLQLGFIILIAATVVLVGEIKEPLIISVIAAISALAGKDLVEYIKGKWKVIVEALSGGKKGGGD